MPPPPCEQAAVASCSRANIQSSLSSLTHAHSLSQYSFKVSGKLAKGVLMGWEPAAGMGPGWLQAFRGGGRLAGGEGEDHAPGARAQVKHLQIMLAFSFFLSFFFRLF